MGCYASRLQASKLTRHLILYSPKPQQSVRQWKQFANDNEANAHQISNVTLHKSGSPLESFQLDLF